MATPFAPGQELTSVTGSNLSSPVLFGNTLFYGREDDIWQATMVPEPVGAGMFVVVAGVLALKRRRRN